MADSTIHGLTALTGANVVPASDELAIWDDDAAITKRITINEVKSAIGLPALGVYAVGDILYASSTSALSRLADVAVGSVLVSGGVGAAPAWSAAPTLTTSLTVPLILAPAATLAIRPTTDAVTAIQLQDKDGNSILNVDTTNNWVGIGTEAPAAKLQMHDGNIYLSDSDVAHGMTTLAPTNVYSSLTLNDDDYGGINLLGLTDGDSPPMQLYAVSGHASPTGPIMSFYAEKKNGTGAQALSASEFAFMFYNYTTPLITVLGSGNVGIGTTSPEAALHVAGGGQYDLIVGATGSSQQLLLGNVSTTYSSIQALLQDSGFTLLALQPLGANVSIGGVAVRGTTAGSGVLHIFDGTAPAGTLANGCSIYSAAGKLYAMDAAGTAYPLGRGNVHSIPADNLTYNGNIISATVDTNAEGIGAPLFMAADGHFDTADADADTTAPCVALALETGTGTKKVLLYGVIRNDAWNWTIGPGRAGLIFLSTTVGTLMQTTDFSEFSTDDVIQVVGWALSADVMMFWPQLNYITKV